MFKKKKKKAIMIFVIEKSKSKMILSKKVRAHLLDRLGDLRVYKPE